MKYIDLLPKKERQFNKNTIALNMVVIILVILLGLMVVSFILLQDTERGLGAMLAQHQETGNKLQGYVDKLEVYEEFEEKVENKAQLVATIEKRDLMWSDIISNLGEVMPPKASLVSFEGSMSELENYIEDYSEENIGQKATSFMVRGYANEYTDVSRLILGLKKLPYIGDAWVESINQTEITGGIEGLEFTVAAFWDTARIVEEWDISEKENDSEETEMDLEQELE